jgi:hypothetical protein
VYSDKAYSYSTGKYSDNNKFDITISGNTAYNNSLSNLEIGLTGTDLATKTQFETAKFTYSLGTFALENNYTIVNPAATFDLEAS